MINNLDYLIVGGGGSGNGGIDSSYFCGGGGGGDVQIGTFSIAPGSYIVTIGAGGLVSDVQGGTSSFNSVNATGGGRGYGAGINVVNGEPGANGGGGTEGGGYTGTGGTSTGGGFAGGNAGTLNTIGGGGGGKTQAGYSQNDPFYPGYGGAGYTSNINGTSDVYGSGGGGGYQSFDGTGSRPGGTNAGNGGVGAQGSYPQIPATAPVANKGGGGGGRASSAGGSDGSAGIVIVHYPTGNFGADSTGGTKTYITISSVNYTIHTFTSSGTLTLTDNVGMLLMFQP